MRSIVRLQRVMEPPSSLWIPAAYSEVALTVVSWKRVVTSSARMWVAERLLPATWRICTLTLPRETDPTRSREDLGPPLPLQLMAAASTAKRHALFPRMRRLYARRAAAENYGRPQVKMGGWGAALPGESSHPEKHLRFRSCART